MSTAFDLKRHIDESMNVVKIANSHYHVWRVFSSSETWPIYVDAMNEYSGFFQLSINAHFTSMIVYIYKCFDKRPDVMGLIRTFEMAKTEGHISQDTINFVEAGLLSFEQTIKGITLVRHKHFAHLDDQQEYSDVMAQAQLTPNKIRDLIIFVIEALNRISGDYQSLFYAVEDFASPRLVQLLDFISSERSSEDSLR